MIVTEERALSLLGDAHAILTNGHFVYTSGNHGSAYINKDAVYTDPCRISLLCKGIAERFLGDDIETVIGPALGGIILSQWTARHLTAMGNGHTVHSVFAEKDGGQFVIRRGYDAYITGKKILVVEDVITTGGSALAVVEAVRTIGGEVVGVGTLCNRGKITEEKLGNVPKLKTLVSVTLDAWQPQECPLCKQGIPINTEVGKGAAFLAAQQKS